jgi:hypothetical protein
MKSIIFWDMTPCSPLSYNRHFGGTYRLHLQGHRNRFSKPESKQVASNRRRYVPPKRQLTLNGLHGIISQKMILFIKITVFRIEQWALLLLFCSEEGGSPSLRNTGKALVHYKESQSNLKDTVVKTSNLARRRNEWIQTV